MSLEKRKVTFTYEVDIDGNLYDCDGKKLKTSGSSGYIIHKPNIFAHQLVAKAFLPNPDNKLLVDHIDGNKSNNNVSNLRWVTPSENSFNKTLTRANNTGYPGIMKTKKGSYRVTFARGKTIGYYPDLPSAVRARVGAEDNHCNSSYCRTNNDNGKIVCCVLADILDDVFLSF
jgi:hypothetical protein